jgi:hypothetical protein
MTAASWLAGVRLTAAARGWHPYEEGRKIRWRRQRVAFALFAGAKTPAAPLSGGLAASGRPQE